MASVLVVVAERKQLLASKQVRPMSFVKYLVFPHTTKITSRG